MVENSGLYVNGKWEKGTGKELISYNPATDAIVWQGNAASPSQVEGAIESGKNACNAWFELAFDERFAYLSRYTEILELSKYSLAEVFSQETGKPLWDSLSEVEAMIGKFSLSVEAFASRCAARTKEQLKGRSFTRHKPHGLLAVFGPYNFPGHLPNGHIVPALLAGNTVILKPSELTPLSGEKIIDCFHQAEFPQGVVQLVQGDKEVGEALYSNPGIDGVLFTGSSATGQLLSRYFGNYPEKMLALEMGGNNPLVIDEIDDLQTAAYLTIQSAFISSGQRCTCARRLIVVNKKETSSFLSILKEMTESIVIGPYTDVPEPFMGPLISPSHAKAVLNAEKKLLDLGATSLLKMKQIKPESTYVTPGIIDVSAIKELPDEEIFGPLLQVIRVESFEEAIRVANQTKFGLVAGLFSHNHEHYRKFYNQIKTGLINWNVQLTGASSAAPFGGIKASGNLRPSGYYSVDYCSYPVASLEKGGIELPSILSPGINAYGQKK